VNIPKPINSARALGRMIRDRRKSMKLTQASTGRLVGIHQTTVSDVERGIINVQIDTILKLIAALRLELVIQPIQSGNIKWEDIWTDNGS
jgi:HTH-type transcriptional regulator/antitoxin HipB